MPDVLEHGSDRPPLLRRTDGSPRRGRQVAAGVVAAVLAVSAGVVVLTRGDVSGVAEQARDYAAALQAQEEAQAAADAARAAAVPPAQGPGDATGAALQPPPDGSFTGADHVLLATDEGVLRMDLATGATVTVELPAPYVPRGRRLLAGDPDVVVLDRGRADPLVSGFATGRETVWVAYGRAAVRAHDGRAVWLDHDTAQGRVLRRLDLARSGAGEPVPFAAPERLVADTPYGLVTGQSPWGEAGDVLLRRHDDGTVVRRVTDEGVVLDAGGRWVVWAACAGCPAALTRLDTGRTWPVRTGDRSGATGGDGGGGGFGGVAGGRTVGRSEAGVPDGVAGTGISERNRVESDRTAASRLAYRGTDGAVSAGRRTADPLSARLAPDGRHLALLVEGERPGTWDVVVDHLPGTERAWAQQTVLRAVSGGPMSGGSPQLRWTASGWLIVSDGYRLYAVGGGPHPTYLVDTAVPVHRQLAAG